jgi:hypothetical protein
MVFFPIPSLHDRVYLVLGLRSLYEQQDETGKPGDGQLEAKLTSRISRSWKLGQLAVTGQNPDC